MNFLTLSSVKISALNEHDKITNVATAFFYENGEGQLFLVTNWHVVTGRSPQKPSFSKTGAIPVSLSFERPTSTTAEGKKAVNLAQLKTITLPINSADGEHPHWLEHPDFGCHVDVVAIPIPNRSEIEKICPIHPVNRCPEFEPRYLPSVMSSVSVVGFPWGQSIGGVLPVYKTGSVASEPNYNQMALPRFLIDCRTASSMSGSPVIGSHSGAWSPPGSVGISGDSLIGTVQNFLGVYSGRLTAAELGKQGDDEVTELGIVWRKETLEAIVNHGVEGASLSSLSADAHNS